MPLIKNVKLCAKCVFNIFWQRIKAVLKTKDYDLTEATEVLLADSQETGKLHMCRPECLLKLWWISTVWYGHFFMYLFIWWMFYSLLKSIWLTWKRPALWCEAVPWGNQICPIWAERKRTWAGHKLTVTALVIGLVTWLVLATLNGAKPWLFHPWLMSFNAALMNCSLYTIVVRLVDEKVNLWPLVDTWQTWWLKPQLLQKLLDLSLEPH